MESPRTLVHESPEGATASAPGGARRRIARADDTRADGPRIGPEELVLGRYRLIERLGAGGFGVVWRAHDELLHREVAVKRIWLGPGGDSERATREALATARLAHPAIVALYEACAVDDAFYLISELVEGDTLARLIADDELDDEQVLDIGLALAAALSHAHARGVIHRDIKPQNVLVPSRPAPAEGAREVSVVAKLTDFGGARLADEDALTRTGDVLGTLAYMAPEQSEGRDVGAQADLYALALVLYESLCGVNPVRGPTPAATVRRIGLPVESLGRHRRDLPRELTDAIDDALAPQPDERGSLADLLEALEDALERGLSPRRRPRRRERAEQATLLQRRPAVARNPVLVGAELPDRHHETPRRRSDEKDVLDLAAAPGRMALPRALWIAGALSLIAWQAVSGRAGVSLLIAAALAPLAALPAERPSARVGPGWLVCVLAPALGVAGLAAAFPAVAGQARGWRDRALRGAIGYWWLILAEPLLARRLWLGQSAGTPPRPAWEGSVEAAAVHVVGPALSVGVLLGALLWAIAATVLPWIVRGRSAVLDVVAATVWAAGIAATTPVLIAGLGGHTLASPRGLVIGAVLAGLTAVAARALRGPV